MLRQRHFRFRTDTGAVDATPTWGAAEDTNYVPGSAAFRLRFSIENPDAEATGSLPFQIYVSKNGGAYAAVTTSSTNGIKSIDAGSDADNTTIVIPRLTTPVWTPLAGAAIDLDFQRRRYYSSSSLADIAPTSVLSISRASIGYAKTAAGTLTSFGTGTLRITDLGLLIEDARTNILNQSVAPDNLGSWTNYQCTLTSGFAAPDGTTTGYSMVENGVNDQHQLLNIPSITSGTSRPFTVSCYLKQKSNNRLIRVSHTDQAGNGYTFDIDLSWNVTVTAVGSGASNPSYTLTALGNGWYYFTAAVTCLTTSTNQRIQLFLMNAANTISYAGDSASGIYVWGFQIEEAAFASSYIPTTTTSATRALDGITLAGNALTIANGSDFSMIAQMNTLAATYRPFLGGGGSALSTVATNGTLQDVQGISQLTSVNLSLAPSTDKAGRSLSSSVNRSIVLNGGSVVTAADGNTQSGAINFGSHANATNTMNGYMTRFTFWNSKLADATLQALTAP
jgi:hypothetical protein